MQYYAKMTGPAPGSNKIYVQVWEVESSDGFVVDKMIRSKTFFTYWGAKKWTEKTIMKLLMKNKLKYFFISDEDVIRKDIA